jgi:hypothetical protein
VIALLCVASGAHSQEHVSIKGTQNIRLSDPVKEAVAMGGVKDQMRCDTAHNIYMPVNRDYSSAYGSIVKVTADGK